jgi:hypothetical protein
MALDKSPGDLAILRPRLMQNMGSPSAEKYRFYGQHYPQLDEFLFKRYFPDVNHVVTEFSAGDWAVTGQLFLR